MANARRGSFRGHSGRASSKMARQFLTQSVVLLQNIGAMQHEQIATGSEAFV